ncbi:MAG: twin-arginine translocase TatA/TatE family subunit [Verrucomicrobiae bacterium]|nr:twin-arginine translocase TatA/TatE family subunit [Verrucomicrobiae bacterium]
MNAILPHPLFAMLGPTEFIIIAVVVVILFGARKVPELMKGLGTGIKEFKKAAKDDETPVKPS